MSGSARTTSACWLFALLCAVSLPAVAQDPLVCDDDQGNPEAGSPEWTARDLNNVACGHQRLADADTSPAFLAKYAEQLLIEEIEFATITLPEWLAEPNRIRLTGSIAQTKVTDPFRSYEEWADAGRGRHLKFYFINNSGAKLRARLLAPLDENETYPALTFTPGLQSYNEVNAWFAQEMAEAGYVVMIIDPQGQGDSEICGHEPDGTPTQHCVFFGNQPADTSSALDFVLSTPSDPYPWALGSNAAGTPTFNPFWESVDRERVGIAGHSLGALAVGPLGQEDARVDAVVAYDNLDSTYPEDLTLRTPTLFFHADYAFPATPTPMLEAPDPTLHLGAFDQLAAADVDAMSVTTRASDHYEWGYQPLPSNFPASRWGERVSLYFSLAWFDRYLKDDPSGTARLTALGFDGSADANSIGAGTYDPELAAANPGDPFAGNAPYTIEGKCVANLLSFYYRSAYRLEGGALQEDDMRDLQCLPEPGVAAGLAACAVLLWAMQRRRDRPDQRTRTV